MQGYGVDANGNVINGELKNVTIPLGQATISKATTNATLQGNLNAAGPVAGGASILTSQPITTAGGTAPIGATPLASLRSTAVPPAPLVAVGDVLTLAGTRGSAQSARQNAHGRADDDRRGSANVHQ